MDLDRPTDKVSLPQYSALTLTGFFFSRYAMLVTPVNYLLCSVNIALFGSSAWHLGRKIKADYIDDQPTWNEFGELTCGEVKEELVRINGKIQEHNIE